MSMKPLLLEFCTQERSAFWIQRKQFGVNIIIERDWSRGHTTSSKSAACFLGDGTCEPIEHDVFESNLQAIS